MSDAFKRAIAFRMAARFVGYNSPRQLAKAAGLSYQVIWPFWAGRARRSRGNRGNDVDYVPPLWVRERIAETLHVPLDDIPDRVPVMPRE